MYEDVIKTLEEIKHNKELTASLDSNIHARDNTKGFIAGLDVAIYRVKQLKEETEEREQG